MAITTYNPGFADAESVNNSPRDNFVYEDLNLFFTRNPVTGDISTVTDIQDIKRAVRNIVLMNTWDKPFHPEIGTNVRASLFENFTPPVLVTLREKMLHALKVWEPRVTVTTIDFSDPQYHNMDSSTLGIIIEFFINNAPQNLEEVEILLKRVR
jgi:phage baseplate assembly protein W